MRIVFAVILLLTPAAVFGQRAPFPIPDPDPEVERKSFVVADGFEVNLYAADPILAKPIQMNFDPQGRLWVASSEVYPQIEPGQKADDKVLILEDADHDGKAEKTTVFARGLLIPTGVEPGDGGAYVANSTELLHFKDTDGDGKADTRRVMLSGFGTEDTHHILHTLRWGFDGQLYFNQSIYIHSHVETPHGVRRLGGGGIWEFRPETMELGVFIRGLVNPWGHHFDRFGQSFATDGAGGEGINYCLPGAYYFTAPDAARILPGLNPGSPKDCGLEVVSGRHFPDDWQGNLLTNDFRGNRVCRYVVSDDGAGFASREQKELIKTPHVAFRPIDVKMGPDGAVYIADWYNPIIQHGEVDFRDPRRDHTRGRIWRVTAKGRPLVPTPKLVGAPVNGLLDALKAPEGWTRTQAKRVLKETATAAGTAKVVPALADWVKRLDANDPEAEHRRLEALWTYQTVDVVEPELLDRLLGSADPRVRAAATRVARHWQNRLSDPVGQFAARVADDHPRVRLEAVRALAHASDARAAMVALGALDRPVDRFLDYALWLTARETQANWLPDVAAGKPALGPNPAHLVFALRAVNSPEAVGPILAALRDGAIPEAQQGEALGLVATLGGPKELSTVFDLALSEGKLTPGQRAGLLAGLAGAARQRKIRPEGDLARLLPLLESPTVPLRAAALRAAGAWKLDGAAERLAAVAGGAGADAAVREAAVDGLADLGTPAGRQALERLAGEGAPRAARPPAIGALAAADPKAAASFAADWLGKGASPDDAQDLTARVARTRNGPAALAAALAGKTIPADVGKLALRGARGVGREDEALTRAIRQAAGLNDAAKPLDAAGKVALLGEVARDGNAARGEAIYRRGELQCLKCHAIAGAGGQVGPGLESIGASAPADYLLDSLLEPGKAVKENYHATALATNDGQVVTGIKVRQNDREVIVRTSEGRLVTVPLANVEEQKEAGSLMPTGLTDPLTRRELIDLVRFLSELGKIGPYSVGQERLVRRWQVVAAGDGNRRIFDASGPAVAASESSSAGLSWSPAYSEVSGTLPVADLPKVRDNPPTAVARFHLDVTTPGAVRVRFPSTAGLSLWVDGKSVPVADTVTLDADRGVHAWTLAVNLNARREGLRVSLDDVPGSPARVQIVTGE